MADVPVAVGEQEAGLAIGPLRQELPDVSQRNLGLVPQLGEDGGIQRVLGKGMRGELAGRDALLDAVPEDLLEGVSEVQLDLRRLGAEGLLEGELRDCRDGLGGDRREERGGGQDQLTSKKAAYTLYAAKLLDQRLDIKIFPEDRLEDLGPLVCLISRQPIQEFVQQSANFAECHPTHTNLHGLCQRATTMAVMDL